MKPYLLLGAALFAMPAASALAAENVSSQDKMFVDQAAIGGMAEVQQGQLAQEKASSSNVKQFGQTMIDQHTPNNQQLISLAKQKGITPPDALDATHQQQLASLKGLSGAQFDAAYITGQIAGHQQMQQVMQQEISQGSDADLKGFATKTLPVVQQHLQMAQQLQGKLGSNATTPMPGTATGTATANAEAPSGTLEKYHGDLRATELNGATVYNDQGNSIGTVNDLLVGEDGKVQNVVLSVGGFLGIGTHYVSVPFEKLQVQPSRPENVQAAGTPASGSPASGTTVANQGAMPASAPATPAAPVGLTPGPTGVPNTTASATDTATQPGNAAPERSYFSLVMPGATKQTLTDMPEFQFRG